MPTEQRDYIALHNLYHCIEQPHWHQLERRLLEIGGELVCMCLEEDLAALLRRGQRPCYKRVKRVRGEPSHCHSNAAWYHELHPWSVVWTGWALSDDGIWRQHSWVMTHRGTLIETTAPRVAYYGFALTREEMIDFDFNNP